jgi:Protein of unknown function (DUF3800)
MLVFIDESGDSGLKLDLGSSQFFVIALVIFDDNSEAESADADISKLRDSLGFNLNAEFKFNKLSNKFRTAFLERASRYKFRYYGVAIKKSGLYGEGFRYKKSFYKYVCGMVFNNAKTHLKNATAIIDDSGDRTFQTELGKYLKNHINTRTEIHIKKVKMEESHRNNLIQLADMVSGAIFRSVKQESPDESFRNIIKAREIYVQHWPC